MIETIDANPGLVIVTLGPLTNLALALRRKPDIVAKVARCVVMGGAPCCEGNVTPAAEYNIWVDPEAAHRVFGSGIDLTMVGLDVTHQALITPAHTERLAAAGRAGTLVAELYNFYARFHERHYGWQGAPVHDAVAVAHVIDPTLLETRHCGVVIDTGPEPSRGRTHADVRHTTDWAANCHVAVGIDSDRFLELLVTRISALG